MSSTLRREYRYWLNVRRFHGVSSLILLLSAIIVPLFSGFSYFVLIMLPALAALGAYISVSLKIYRWEIDNKIKLIDAYKKGEK